MAILRLLLSPPLPPGYLHFTSSNSLIASIRGTTVTTLNAGTVDITANQAGGTIMRHQLSLKYL